MNDYLMYLSEYTVSLVFSLGLSAQVAAAICTQMPVGLSLPITATCFLLCLIYTWHIKPTERSNSVFILAIFSAISSCLLILYGLLSLQQASFFIQEMLPLSLTYLLVIGVGMNIARLYHLINRHPSCNIQTITLSALLTATMILHPLLAPIAFVLTNLIAYNLCHPNTLIASLVLTTTGLFYIKSYSIILPFIAPFTHLPLTYFACKALLTIGLAVLVWNTTQFSLTETENFFSRSNKLTVTGVLMSTLSFIASIGFSQLTSPGFFSMETVLGGALSFIHLSNSLHAIYNRKYQFDITMPSVLLVYNTLLLILYRSWLAWARPHILLELQSIFRQKIYRNISVKSIFCLGFFGLHMTACRSTHEKKPANKSSDKQPLASGIF